MWELSWGQVTTEGKSFPTCVPWPSHWCGFSSRLVVQSYSRIFSDVLREHLMRSLWIFMQHVSLLLSPNFFLKKIAELWLPVCVDSLGPPVPDWSSFRVIQVRSGNFLFLTGVLLWEFLKKKTEKYMIKNTNLDKYILNEIWEPCCSAHSFVCKAHNELYE